MDMLYVQHSGHETVGRKNMAPAFVSAWVSEAIALPCAAPMTVRWNPISRRTVGGHNRTSICDKHGVLYRMVMFSFEDEQWTLNAQKSRCHIEKWELGKIDLKLKPGIEARARTGQFGVDGDKNGEKKQLINSKSKTEALQPCNPQMSRQARMLVLDYIDFFNGERMSLKQPNA